MISVAQLHAFAPACDAQVWVDALNAAFLVGQISTPARVSHFMAQTYEESGGYTALVENLNYSVQALLKEWPSRFTPTLAAECAHQPQRIAGIVYANRMGNGDAASGDGWTYRGRGLLGLTGRWAYGVQAKALGLDLVNHPDLLEQPRNAAMSAAVFWRDEELNPLADAGDIVALTKKINGGLTNLSARQAAYAKARTIFGG